MVTVIVRDKKNQQLHVNTLVKYRGMRSVVTELVNTTTVKIRTGGMIEKVAASRVEKL